ncbi:MAG: NAD(P)H-hydrate dehydratase [Bacteroidia bacterium]|nr:NAD(P)H-hydrate dehydratase [Bacteroidia bacterium]
MKILSNKQIRALDLQTIKQEKIASLDLMERASKTFVSWFLKRFDPLKKDRILILCGNGNNGGDGMAVARLLADEEFDVDVVLHEYLDKPSDDFTANRQRLPSAVTLRSIEKKEDGNYDFIIDALWGSGLSRPIGEPAAALIEWANDQDAIRVAIDIPSGLHADQYIESVAFKAHHTGSFELPKLSFFFPQNKEIAGDWDVLSIGLDEKFIAEQSALAETVDADYARETLQKRDPFGHKNSFGHALIVAGSIGKCGAALMAGKSCLAGGAGLVTLHLPSRFINSAHAFCPELMVSPDAHENYIVSGPPDISAYNSVCIGPGMDTKSESLPVLKNVLESGLPLVIDADALNLIGKEQLHDLIPKNAILTPHPGEFKRLFGESKNDYEALDLQVEKSIQYGIYILRKGKYSCISCPDGSVYFNTSGNVALATAGSGDVLSGLITSFLAQGYNAKESVLLGAYIHGAAADAYVEASGTDRMTATQIIHFISGVIGQYTAT